MSHARSSSVPLERGREPRWAWTRLQSCSGIDTPSAVGAAKMDILRQKQPRQSQDAATLSSQPQQFSPEEAEPPEDAITQTRREISAPLHNIHTSFRPTVVESVAESVVKASRTKMDGSVARDDRGRKDASAFSGNPERDPGLESRMKEYLTRTIGIASAPDVTRYTARLLDEGYDTPEIFSDLTLEELSVEFEFKQGHVKKVQAFRQASTGSPVGTRLEDGSTLVLSDSIIGRGASGIVRKATLIKRSGATEEVAAKMLAVGASEREVKKFAKELEISISAAQKCCGVCRIHGCVVVEGALCLVMKLYVSDFTTVLKLHHTAQETHLPLPLKEERCYMTQIARALVELHAVGICVQDLKPSNLLVDDAGQLFVADFGIAVLAGETVTSTASRTGDGAGTAHYMAPEQHDADTFGKVTCKADVWAWACIAVEMLSGEKPWNSKRPLEIMCCVVMKKQTPTIPPGIPDWLLELLEQSFSHIASERPTAAEILDRLQANPIVHTLAHSGAAGAPPPASMAARGAESEPAKVQAAARGLSPRQVSGLPESISEHGMIHVDVGGSSNVGLGGLYMSIDENHAAIRIQAVWRGVSTRATCDVRNIDAELDIRSSCSPQAVRIKQPPSTVEGWARLLERIDTETNVRIAPEPEPEPEHLVDRVTFGARTHPEVGRQDALFYRHSMLMGLTNGQKQETLRQYYSLVGNRRTEAEITRTVALYASEAAWDALMIKLENKYGKAVQPWRGDSPRVPVDVYRKLGQRKACELVSCEHRTLVQAMGMVYVPPSCTCVYSDATTASSKEVMDFKSLVGAQRVMLKITGPEKAVVRRCKRSVDTAIARVREQDETAAAVKNSRQAVADLAAAVRAPLPWVADTTWSAGLVSRTFTNSAQNEEVLTIPEVQYHLVEVIAGKNNDNLPSGVNIFRGPTLDGLIKLTISGSPAIVDSTKCLIESMLGVEASPLDSTLQTAHNAQLSAHVSSLDMPDLPLTAFDTLVDANDVAGEQRAHIGEAELRAVANFASTLDEAVCLSSSDKSTVESLFREALEALQDADYGVILSDQLIRIGFREYGCFGAHVVVNSQAIKRVGEICAGLATVSSFEEAWGVVDRSCDDE